MGEFCRFFSRVDLIPVYLELPYPAHKRFALQDDNEQDEGFVQGAMELGAVAALSNVDLLEAGGAP